MTFIADILPIIQVIISVVLVVIILLQQSEGGLGSAFGGGDGGSYQTRRGFEKILFVTTIVLGTLFVLSTLLALILK